MKQAAAIEWWRREPLSPALARPEGPRRAESAGADAREGSLLPFRALLAFLFVMLLAPQSLFPPLASLRPALLAALVAIAAHLADCFARRRPFTVWSREMTLVAALVAWAVAMAPLSYWPGGSVALLTDIYLKAVAVFWLIANVAGSPSRLRQLLWALALMSVPLGLTAARNLASGAFIAGAQARIIGYDAPLTQNPNDLALTLNVIFPLTLALREATSAPASRAALLGVAAIQAGGVVCTFSRAGFVTLAVILAGCALRGIRRGRSAGVLALLVAALAALPVLPEGYLERLSTIAHIDSDPTGSAQARWGDTGAALALVAENPIVGAGPGMSVLALNDVRGPRWTAVHNAYLEHAVDLGLPGLALFLALLASCFAAARSAGRARPAGPEGRGLACFADGMQASLAAFAVAAMFHPVAYQFYGFILAGLVVAARSAGDGLVGTGGAAEDDAR